MHFKLEKCPQAHSYMGFLPGVLLASCLGNSLNAGPSSWQLLANSWLLSLLPNYCMPVKGGLSAVFLVPYTSLGLVVAGYNLIRPLLVPLCMAWRCGGERVR